MGALPGALKSAYAYEGHETHGRRLRTSISYHRARTSGLQNRTQQTFVLVQTGFERAFKNLGAAP